MNINRIEVPVDPYKAFKCDVPNLSTSLYFIVNDQFRSALQPKENLPEGVVVTSLAEYAKENPEFVAKHYAQLAKTNEDAITALNTMLAQDGLLVYVKKNVIVDKTVQVINILRSNVALMVNRRVLIVMEEGASAKFLFCDHAADDLQFLTTQVIEAYVGANASLDLYCMEFVSANSDHGGADRVIEVAGAKTTFQLAWQCARPNAIVTVVALYDEPQILPLPDMYGKNLTFKTGGVDGCDCEQVLKLIEQGKIDTTPLITHRFPLSQIEEAYRIFENKEDGVIKIAIYNE